MFTGNILLVMAWTDGKISFNEVLKNWVVVCISNFIGAFGLALIVYLSRHPQLNDGSIAEQYIKLASTKCNISF